MMMHIKAVTHLPGHAIRMGSPHFKKGAMFLTFEN